MWIGLTDHKTEHKLTTSVDTLISTTNRTYPLGFFNQPVFLELLEVSTVQKSNLSWEMLWQFFYMLNALTVIQSTKALKDDSVPDWGLHAATRGQEH